MAASSRLIACALIATLTLALGSPHAGAIINPELQPIDLFRRYLAIHTCEVGAQVEGAPATTRSLDLVATHRGEAPADGAILEGVGDLAGAITELPAGTRLVAFVGRERPRSRRDQVLVYDGTWMIGTRTTTPAGGERWVVERSADADGGAMMAGTFNGEVRAFSRLMSELADGRAWLPSRPHASFGEELLVDDRDAAITGIALADFDGNGLVDLLASSELGDELYLQTAPLELTPAGEALGLGWTASPGVALADADCDGDIDLLLGGILFEAHDRLEERFVATERLPDSLADGLVAAAFAEIDGDGYPDIVACRRGKGLIVLANPGATGGAFVDRTTAAGLDGIATEGEPFAVGDWSGDGRADLFVATGSGRLLVQDSEGRFEPVGKELGIDFGLALEDEGGITGGATFASIFETPRLDLIVPADASTHLFANRDGMPVEVTEHGNEISEAAITQRATLAEDLDSDGRTDLYTITRLKGREQRLHIYRGYGTFMNATKYASSLLAGPAHREGGCTSAAAGDIDGDGAADLVLGLGDGALVLLVSECVEARADPGERPTPEEEILAGIARLTVRFADARALIGATLTLRDAEGRLVGHRVVGAGSMPGSSSLAPIAFAVRHPGEHRLAVRWSDGLERELALELAAGTLTRLEAARPRQE
jgi:hypothetical protein